MAGAGGAGGVPTWVVLCALVVVQVGFGAYGIVVTKFAQKNKANPLVFSLFRDLCCFPVLMLAAFVAEKKIMLPTLREFPIFILLGFLGMFCNQLLYILGVYWAGPDIASAFQPAIPVWAAFFAILFRVEKLPSLRKLYTWAKLLGILCAAAGAIGMTVFKPVSSSSSSSGNTTESPDTVTTACAQDATKHNSHDTVIGCIMLLGNTVAMSFYVLAQKKLIFMKTEQRFSDMPVNVTAWCYFFGAVFMALASPLAKTVQQPVCGVKSDPWHIPLEVTYPIEYAIFIASALCYLLITWSTMQISATLVTAFWPLQVPVAIVMAYFVLEDRLNWQQYVFCGLIILGLLFVVLANRVQEKKRPDEVRPTRAGQCASTG
eukprot:scpid66188/ scgid8743/ 